jgi:hypothetical protein
MRTIDARRVLVAGLLLAASSRAGAQEVTGPGCAWLSKLDPTVTNVLYPDQFANYWTTVLPAVPGETLTIRGEYPHGRYMSFTTYANGQSVDGLNDQRIVPDPGSANPFLPGADRTVLARNYTVTAVFEQRPPNAPDNTLFTTNEDGSKSGRTFVITYRVYRADLGENDRGGVPLPTITVNLPSGGTYELPECDLPPIPPNDVNDTIAQASVPWPMLFGYPGTNPPTWHKFYNFQTSIAQGFTDNGATGTAISDALFPVTTQFPKGGFLDNPDNNYVSAFLNPGFGPVVVVKGTLPTFAATYPNATSMPAGVQLRYWSLCSYEALSQRYLACIADDEVQIDADRHYTIVVSSSANRPGCASDDAMNVNWLPAGPFSDTLLILRNMLPDSSFTNSIQQAGYGTEKQDMGAYFPDARYVTGGCD